jgi:hypothetical protein
VDFVLRAEWNVAFSTYGKHCPYQSLAEYPYGIPISKKYANIKRCCSVGIIKNLIKTLFTGKIPAF